MNALIELKTRTELELRRREKANLPLQKFIALKKGYDEPYHLKPLTDALERAMHGAGDVYFIFSVPPQHGKTETLLHALIQQCMKNPHKRNAYASYNATFTKGKQNEAKRILEYAPVTFSTMNTTLWETPEGGGIVWTSRQGGLTGRAIDGMIVLDDLLKNRAEAQSPASKKEAEDFIRSSVLSRMHPSASLVLVATRWSPDDPSGVFKDEKGWEYVNIPAEKDGVALWPERRPIEFLQDKRSKMNDWDYEALYLGRPRPRGHTVFKGEHFYDTLPTGKGYQKFVGFDGAYTSRSYSDYSVAVIGRKYGENFYITSLLREQRRPEQFIELLKANGVEKVHWIRSGTEIGLEELLKANGIQVRSKTATTDKYARALPIATMWNEGRILLPDGADWLPEFLSEISSFTGTSADRHDDIVDALAALGDVINKDTAEFARY